MESNGKNKASLVVTIILAIGIVLAAALCIYWNFSLGTKKLNAGNHQLESTEAGTEQAIQSTEVETDITAFSINKDGSAAPKTEAGSETAGTTTGNTGDYLCDYSSQRQMTDADIATLKAGTYGNLPAGKSIIRMVINEMYAKYGYQFTTTDVQSYFDQKTWYQAIANKTNNMDQIYQSMTDVEKANVDFLTTNDK